MPWYGFAALPLLALRKPNLLTWTVALYARSILVGEQFPSLAPSAVGTRSASGAAVRRAGRRAHRAASS